MCTAASRLKHCRHVLQIVARSIMRQILKSFIKDDMYTAQGAAIGTVGPGEASRKAYVTGEVSHEAYNKKVDMDPAQGADIGIADVPQAAAMGTGDLP